MIFDKIGIEIVILVKLFLHNVDRGGWIWWELGRSTHNVWWVNDPLNVGWISVHNDIFVLD